MEGGGTPSDVQQPNTEADFWAAADFDLDVNRASHKCWKENRVSTKNNNKQQKKDFRNP